MEVVCPQVKAGRANSGQGGGELGRSSGDEARRPCRATASRPRAASRLRTPYGAQNHGSKSRTRAASRRRRWPTPKPLSSSCWEKDLLRAGSATRRGRVEEELHVRFLRELGGYHRQKVAYRVGRQAPVTAVLEPYLIPPHVSLGWNCRTFNGHPRPRGGARPPGRPSGPSRLGTP